jgi:hypothetical protein
VEVGPLSSTGHSAADLRLIVLGLNGADGAVTSSPRAASFGQKNQVRAQVIVPSGTLKIRAHSAVRGVFIGKWLVAGQHVEATVEDPLTPPPAPDAGQVADAAMDLPPPDASVVIHDVLLPDAPRADAPHADAPRADAPHADAPYADAPHADAPRADAPHADAPHTDAPQADAPLLDKGKDAPKEGPLSDHPLPPDLGGTLIGPAGGVALSSDGMARLEVPAQALSEPVRFFLTVSSSAPSGHLDTAYDLQPASTHFAVPATVRLNFDPSSICCLFPAMSTLEAFYTGRAPALMSGEPDFVGELNNRV